MGKNPKKSRPQTVDDRPPESIDLLTAELRRRGMSDAEIAAELKKKKRRRSLEFNAVRYPAHALAPLPTEDPQLRPKPRPIGPAHRQATPPAADELCTVDFAAARLKLHPKTILRFIHEGRLRGTRLGKAYRILRADLETFAGVPPRVETPAEDAWVTSIVDLPGVGAALARKWEQVVVSALAAQPREGAPLSAQVIYEADRSHLKIVMVGGPKDMANLLSLIQVWLEQLRA